MESVSKFKTYLNSILNTIDDDVHNELWNHLSDVFAECFEVNSKLQEARELIERIKPDIENLSSMAYSREKREFKAWIEDADDFLS